MKIRQTPGIKRPKKTKMKFPRCDFAIDRSCCTRVTPYRVTNGSCRIAFWVF